MVASARNATTSCKQITQPNGKQSSGLKKGREEGRIPTIVVRKKVSGENNCGLISGGGIVVSDNTDVVEHRAVSQSDRAFRSLATGKDRGKLGQIAQTETQNILEKELERLKHKLQVGYELKVIWIPDNGSKLAGEVRGDAIFVYDATEGEALETLRHEFLDYAVSKVIEPYREVTNKLILLINEDAYKEKEKLVEALSQLLK